MPGAPTNRRAVELWVGEFRRHVAAWLESGRVRDDLLQSALHDLELWLERAPSDAAAVQAIALDAALIAQYGASPNVVAAFARFGCTADLLITDQDDARNARRIFLYLMIAECELQCANAYGGLDAIELAKAFTREHPPQEPLSTFLEGYGTYLRGALHELGLDFPLASEAHAAAGAILDPLVLAADRLADCAMAMVKLFFGGSVAAIPGNQRGEMLMHCVDRIRAITALNATARMRALTAIHADVDLEPVALASWKVLRATGIPAAMGPFDVIELVMALPRPCADEAKAMLIEKVGQARNDADDWRLVLHSTLLFRSANESDRATLANTITDQLSRTTDPLIAAFARGSLLQNAPASGDVVGELTGGFLASLGRLVELRPAALNDLRVRARFEGAVAASIDFAIDEFKAVPSAVRRTRLAVLLDALRGSRLSDWSVAASDHAPPNGTPRAGLMLALDRLQRIAHALESRPGAVAIVVERRGRNTRFVCVGGGVPRIRIVDAGDSFARAAQHLSDLLDRDLATFELTADLPDAADVLGACTNAYLTLPQELRETIAASNTLLIVPDYRVSGNNLHFELFHDGSAFLGVSRVVARFTTLRGLTRAVEHSARRATHRRALVLSASHPPKQPELVRARPETERIRSVLASAGWDAPDIDESRFTPDFLSDRLPFVAFLYVAAHGEVDLTEGIVLNDGRRFTTDDLLKAPFPQLPFAFINTCSLGSSQYRGAGISRGVAHTLVETGAPAAIANVLPVEDGVSSEIALQFLALAQQHPVGEALRRTRATVSVGRHPLLWGTTILTGDPWTMLSPLDDGQRPLTDQLVDASFTFMPDPAVRDDVTRRGLLQSRTDQGDVRLRAAIAMLQHAARLTSLATADEQHHWHDVIRLADELDNLPARAAARFVLLTSPLAANQSPGWRAQAVAEARPYLKAMSAIDTRWIQRVQEIDSIDSPIRYEVHPSKTRR